MSEINTGGPAFPRPQAETSQGGNYEQDGMSLLDWFAGQALPMAMRSYGPEGAAEEAYQYAEAMIARRSMLETREVAK